MGLDMYLDMRNDRYFSEYSKPEGMEMAQILEIMDQLGIPHIKGMDDEVISVEISQRVGYWRKHANLHGFIVSNFAQEDDCEPIYLSTTSIEAVIEAITDDELYETEGFFFGKSPSMNSDDPEEVKWAQQRKEGDLEIFQLAHKLSSNAEIYYRASW